LDDRCPSFKEVTTFNLQVTANAETGFEWFFQAIGEVFEVKCLSARKDVYSKVLEEGAPKLVGLT
jgi:hypothetical protein